MADCMVTLLLKNCQTETEKLAACVRDIGNSLNLSKKTIFAITLAIEELFTNIVSYGYADHQEHTICIRMTQENGTLVLCVEDDGMPFDSVKAEAPDLECTLEDSKIGGLGIHLAKKMMDEFVYERRGNKNIITMKKHILND